MRSRAEMTTAGLALGALLLAAIMCGCAHTHEISTALSGTEMRAAMRGLENREVSVMLLNGNEVDGYVRALDIDTLSLSIMDQTKKSAIRYVDIQKITATNRGNGFGVLVGILLGCTIGAVLGADAGYEPGSLLNLSQEFAVAGGIAGAVIGGLIGSGFPQDDTYIFRALEPETLVLLVDRVLEDDATYIKVRIGGQNYILAKSECELMRLPSGLYVKGPRTFFRKLGVPLP